MKKQVFSSLLQFNQGSPLILGITRDALGINFAVSAKDARRLSLRFFTEQDTKQPFLEVPLDPVKNKTGDVWHIHITGLPSEFLVVYWLLSNTENRSYLLLDPYASHIHSHNHWGKLTGSHYFPWGKITPPSSFDWQNDSHPNISLKNLIIYEMHVRGFTVDPSSQVSHPGTFLGIIEKIPYLKSLGVNAVELLPVFEFNEEEVKRFNLQSAHKLVNYFGYSPVNFFSPMNRYRSLQDTQNTLDQFKTMVRELHKDGIEVILDVVYNHTAESKTPPDLFSMRGFDKKGYYCLSESGEDLNFSGCGNTLNANSTLSHDLILSSLRYWVSEMHVDGFRFDLATILKRDQQGNLIPSNSIVEAISNDSVLANTKLIAEAWDPAGLYLVGHFCDTARWLEWNGPYRDTVRRFIRGTSHQKSSFATVICGSQNLYGQKGKSPLCSVNFVTCHDGFSLRDLVSYNEKHNLPNGENNRDGSDQNDSWNCGLEGKTSNKKVLQLRERQMRNFMLTLFISQGIPMLSMGDEYAHTRHGNNNTWCQDNALNWFSWDDLTNNQGFFRFVRLLIEFRTQHKIFNKGDFLNDSDISWHGTKPFLPEWDRDNRFIAFVLNESRNPKFYVAFNANSIKQTIQLPHVGHNHCWKIIVNTQAQSPHDFILPQQRVPLKGDTHLMESYSAILLENSPRE